MRKEYISAAGLILAFIAFAFMISDCRGQSEGKVIPNVNGMKMPRTFTQREMDVAFTNGWWSGANADMRVSAWYHSKTPGDRVEENATDSAFSQDSLVFARNRDSVIRFYPNIKAGPDQPFQPPKERTHCYIWGKDSIWVSGNDLSMMTSIRKGFVEVLTVDFAADTLYFRLPLPSNKSTTTTHINHVNTLTIQ